MVRTALVSWLYQLVKSLFKVTRVSPTALVSSVYQLVKSLFNVTCVSHSPGKLVISAVLVFV